jgi:steroid 5-alpha reductase family enzyme
MIEMLLINFLILMAAIILLWIISVRIRDVSFIDSFWAFGMVIMAGATFVQLGGGAQSEGSPARMVLIVTLTSLWGVRLALHLLTRWRKEGVDPRYARILGSVMEKKGWSFAKASLIQVFLLQAPLLFLVCLPAQLGQVASSPAQLGPLAWIGGAIALIGIAFESIGDHQLRRFKLDPATKGKVLDTGLWRFTRHPNYFGDCCTWWGIWLIAAETVPGRFAVIGPLLLTFLLVKWSGVPLLERGLKKSRPGYEDYLRRTPAFFPWFPKD